ncbi:hypothetical protein AB1L30_15975 [Bremerella sp. JC817]|uniref:hypothetical protein n=1 Tax=Bremerella sp. JC817 TaxID=3231756 RepID=UPI0034579613
MGNCRSAAAKIPKVNLFGLLMVAAVAVAVLGGAGEVLAADPQPTEAPTSELYSVGVDFTVVVDAIAYRIGEFLNKWIFFVIGFGVVLAIVAFMKRGK